MAKGSFLTAIVLGLLASVTNVAALPNAPNVVEVIPGPGLPSLASLGLTSADLFKDIPAAESKETGPLTKRFDAFCSTFSLANRDNAIACYNYLNALGTQQCGLNTDNIVFCSAGEALIYGSKLAGSSVSSYCRDVATGALWIINNCNNANRVQGAAAAYGNGNLVVSIQHN